MAIASIKSLPFAVVALVSASAAFAQAPPPPGSVPPPPGAPLSPDRPPPPPPPPRGPAVLIERGPDRNLRLDVHCTDSETTRACTDLATQLFDKLNGDIQPK